jgi:hypothetical protein
MTGRRVVGTIVAVALVAAALATLFGALFVFLYIGGDVQTEGAGACNGGRTAYGLLLSPWPSPRLPPPAWRSSGRFAIGALGARQSSPPGDGNLDRPARTDSGRAGDMLIGSETEV